MIFPHLGFPPSPRASESARRTWLTGVLEYQLARQQQSRRATQLAVLRVLAVAMVIAALVALWGAR